MVAVGRTRRSREKVKGEGRGTREKEGVCGWEVRRWMSVDT